MSDQHAEVPDQRCPKCGHTATMRYCWPTPLDTFHACVGRDEHMHRQCGRCGYGWVTDDVLPDHASRAARFDADAAWWTERGEPRLAEVCRHRADAERAKLEAA